MKIVLLEIREQVIANGMFTIGYRFDLAERPVKGEQRRGEDDA